MLIHSRHEFLGHPYLSTPYEWEVKNINSFLELLGDPLEGLKNDPPHSNPRKTLPNSGIAFGSNGDFTIGYIFSLVKGKNCLDTVLTTPPSGR